jgi:hypothetical protein
MENVLDMSSSTPADAAAARITNLEDQAADQAARPDWQDRPCPPWCMRVIPHKDGDQLDSRFHMSSCYDITLTLEAADITRFPDGNGGAVLEVSPAFITAQLLQDWRDRDSRVALTHDGVHDIELTVAEARDLAEALSSLVKQADDAAEDVRAEGKP